MLWPAFIRAPRRRRRSSKANSISIPIVLLIQVDYAHCFQFATVEFGVSMFLLPFHIKPLAGCENLREINLAWFMCGFEGDKGSSSVNPKAFFNGVGTDLIAHRIVEIFNQFCTKSLTSTWMKYRVMTSSPTGRVARCGLRFESRVDLKRNNFDSDCLVSHSTIPVSQGEVRIRCTNFSLQSFHSLQTAYGPDTCHSSPAETESISHSFR
jgi:hypothetical protein